MDISKKVDLKSIKSPMETMVHHTYFHFLTLTKPGYSRVYHLAFVCENGLLLVINRKASSIWYLSERLMIDEQWDKILNILLRLAYYVCDYMSFTKDLSAKGSITAFLMRRTEENLIHSFLNNTSTPTLFKASCHFPVELGKLWL